MAGALEAGATKTEDGPSKSRSTGLCSAASRRHWRPSAQEEHEGRESERAIEEVNDAVKKGDTESKYSILSADVDVNSMSSRNNTADTTTTTNTSTTTAKGQTNLANSFSAVLVRSPCLQGKQVNGQAIGSVQR